MGKLKGNHQSTGTKKGEAMSSSIKSYLSSVMGAIETEIDRVEVRMDSAMKKPALSGLKINIVDLTEPTHRQFTSQTSPDDLNSV